MQHSHEYIQSKYRVIHLYLSAALHHVLECANLALMRAASCSKVTWLWRLLNWVYLLSNTGSNIVCLVLVRKFSLASWAACFRQSPPRVIQVIRGVRWGLWYITAWPNCHRSWCNGFQTASSSVAEGVIRVDLQLRFGTRKILRPWNLF